MHESLCLLTTMQAAGVYKEKRAASTHTSQEQPGCFLQGCVCVCVCPLVPKPSHKYMHEQGCSVSCSKTCWSSETTSITAATLKGGPGAGPGSGVHLTPHLCLNAHCPRPKRLTWSRAGPGVGLLQTCH